MTRTPRILASLLFALAIGCGGDDDGGGTDAGPMCRPDGNPCASNADCCSGTCGADMLCGGGGGEDAGPVTSPEPMITRIEWSTPAGCTDGSASDFDIAVTVVDSDTPAGDLTFTGNVTGCTGTIDGAMSTINCPNLAPYGGMVTVADPDGNSDAESFSFGPCETGGADF